ncbi:MAG: hypothetical protein ABGX43_09290 [Nitrospinaceae bacterium]|nr:hypothetical protein [Gammaproteobacteria bacterium]
MEEILSAIYLALLLLIAVEAVKLNLTLKTTPNVANTYRIFSIGVIIVCGIAAAYHAYVITPTGINGVIAPW